MIKHCVFRSSLGYFVARLLVVFTAIVGLGSVSLAQAQPALSIVKTASSNALTVGSQLVYTLEIANTGNADATNVVVQDDLSSRVIFNAATGGGSIGNQDPKGALVTWNFASIAPGQSGSVSVITTVDASVLQSWDNSATIISDQTALAQSNTVTVIVLDDPELSLTKTVSRTDVNAGDTLVYTLAYRNSGPTAANNVILTDTLDANLTNASANNGGVLVGNEITWTTSVLEPGQTGSVTFTATATAAPNGTIISNTATLDSDETAAINSNSVGTTILSQTAIDVRATSTPNSVQPGGTVQFTTEVENLTANPAEDVVITALIPDNTSYVSNIGGGNFNGDRVTWSIGNIGALQSTSVVLSVRLDDNLANGDPVDYSANVTLSNGTSEGAGLIIFVSSQPALGLQKTASRTTVGAAEQLTYTLNFTNQGAEEPGAILRDYLPFQTQFISATDGGTHSSGVVSWNLGALPSGTNDSVSVTVQTGTPLLNGTVLSNVASLEASLGLGVSASADVTASTLPNLTLNKSSSQSVVSAGELLNYTLFYQNTGATIANNVVIADVLPPGTSFRPPSSGGAAADGVVTWDIGTVGPGQSGTVELTVEVDDVLPNGTVLHNSSSIRSDETPPNQAPLVDTIVDSRPDLQLTKDASAAQVAPGNNVTYTINYENTGSDTASDVVISDLLPDMTTFISASNNGAFDALAGVVSWNIGSVEALSSGSVSLVVAIQQDTPIGTVIVNTAGIESAETGLAVADASVIAKAGHDVDPKAIPALPFLALALLTLLLGCIGLHRQANQSDPTP